MSDDTADDMAAAEDFAARAAACLLGLFQFSRSNPWTGLADDAGGRSLAACARELAEEWLSFCRPTCGADGDRGYTECDDLCACPCNHTGWRDEIPGSSPPCAPFAAAGPPRPDSRPLWGAPPYEGEEG